MNKSRIHSGYTLVELIVAVGLFALIMLLSSGAYLFMISINRQTQAITTGIDNLSSALEFMTREIRTGTNYVCVGGGTNCGIRGDLNSFSFTNQSGDTVSYRLVFDSSGSGSLQRSDTPPAGSTVVSTLTDPSINITQLYFQVYGALPASSSDTTQARVFIETTGTVTYGTNKTQAFTVQSVATMRGSDL